MATTKRVERTTQRQTRMEMRSEEDEVSEKRRGK